MRDSVCYVMPFHSRADDQHFAHLPRLLTKVANHCDLYVIVERGGVAPEIPGAKMVLVQKTSPERRTRRYLELLTLVQQVRKAGCRRFFVRISIGAGLVLIAARRLLDLEVYYWNSGQGRQAWPLDRDLLMSLRLSGSDRLLGFVIRRADRFVTGPERMIEYYIREYNVPPEKCLLLYNDVDCSLYQPVDDAVRDHLRKRLGFPPAAACVLFVGRISRYKGGEFVLPLATALRSPAETPDVHISVVGSIHLANLASALEADPSVQLVGAKPSNEIVPYMQAADLFILPSLSEGFPRVVIEAMACGLPIVAFDVGGVRDILGPAQQGCVVPRGDVDAMAATIRRVLADPALIERLREENLREVARFSTDEVASMFVERIVSA
jgi:glycosyltransferase involved in cell wall biosynthesis